MLVHKPLKQITDMAVTTALCEVLREGISSENLVDTKIVVRHCRALCYDQRKHAVLPPTPVILHQERVT